MDLVTYRNAIAARDNMMEELNNDNSYWLWTRVACISVVKEDGTYHLSNNQACHAGLDSDECEKAVGVVSALMKPRGANMLDWEEAYAYIDYLINRSPYAPTFISKDAREVIANKALISDGHTPSNLMAAGLVASRRLWEYTEPVRVFYSLVKAGVMEDLAYLLGHMALTSMKKDGNFQWNRTMQGHSAIATGYMNDTTMLNFLKHKPTNLNKTYYENHNYEGYHAMFNGDGKNHGCMRTFIHTNFPYKKKEDAKAINPFPVAKVGNDHCSYDYAITTMADFQHTILKEIGYA